MSLKDNEVHRRYIDNEIKMMTKMKNEDNNDNKYE